MSESERKKLTGTVKDWLRDVKIVKEEEWGQKALAYKIKKENAGFYLNYELEAEVIPGDFEKRIIGQDAIIRHLLVRSQSSRLPKPGTGGQVKLKVKSEKEEKPTPVKSKPKVEKKVVKIADKKPAKKIVKKK